MSAAADSQPPVPVPMPAPAPAPAPSPAPAPPPPPPPKTLLSVLPLTTALTGAGVVVVLPAVGVVAGAVARRSADDLQVFAMIFPFMLVGAIGTAAFGAAAGALAGLPDRLLPRTRAPRLLGSVAAVVILTVIVGGAWASASTVVDLFLPPGIGVVAVSVCTAVLTTIVVAVSRLRAPEPEPGAEHR